MDYASSLKDTCHLRRECRAMAVQAVAHGSELSGMSSRMQAPVHCVHPEKKGRGGGCSGRRLRQSWAQGGMPASA